MYIGDQLSSNKDSNHNDNYEDFEMNEFNTNSSSAPNFSTNYNGDINYNFVSNEDDFVSNEDPSSANFSENKLSELVQNINASHQSIRESLLSLEQISAVKLPNGSNSELENYLQQIKSVYVTTVSNLQSLNIEKNDQTLEILQGYKFIINSIENNLQFVDYSFQYVFDEDIDLKTRDAIRAKICDLMDASSSLAKTWKINHISEDGTLIIPGTNDVGELRAGDQEDLSDEIQNLQNRCARTYDSLKSILDPIKQSKNQANLDFEIDNKNTSKNQSQEDSNEEQAKPIVPPQIDPEQKKKRKNTPPQINQEQESANSDDPTQFNSEQPQQSKQPQPNANQPSNDNPNPVNQPVGNKLAVQEYVALLRAKEKWFRNKSDKEILSREDQIRTNFKNFAQEHLAKRVNDPDALAGLYSQLRDEFSQNRGKLHKFITWARKPVVAVSRAVLAAGLITAGILTGGAGFVIAGTAIGAFGRFMAVDAVYDRIHAAVSSTKNKAEYGMASTIFYSRKDDKILNLAHAQSQKNDRRQSELNVVDVIINDSIRYANNLKKHKLVKTVLATATAVFAPFVGSAIANYLGIAKDSAVDSATSLSSLDSNGAISGPFENSAVLPPDVWANTYVVPDGGGIWHISKEIAKQKIDNFENLTLKDKNIVINTIKNYIIDNQSKVGLENHEIIARASNKGGPWLAKKADLIFTNDDLNQALSSKSMSNRLRNLISVDTSKVSDMLKAGKSAITSSKISSGQVARFSL